MNFTRFLFLLLVGNSCAVCSSNITSLLVPIDINPSTQAAPISFQKIQALRAEGKLDTAIQLAQTYLNARPKDTDIMLLLGLMLENKLCQLLHREEPDCPLQR